MAAAAQVLIRRPPARQGQLAEMNGLRACQACQASSRARRKWPGGGDEFSSAGRAGGGRRAAGRFAAWLPGFSRGVNRVPERAPLPLHLVAAGALNGRARSPTQTRSCAAQVRASGATTRSPVNLSRLAATTNRNARERERSAPPGLRAFSARAIRITWRRSIASRPMWA